MIEVCNCADDSTIQNFGGIEGCIDGIGVAERVIFLSQLKEDGVTPNGIDIANDTLDAAFFNSKFKDPIIRDRWLYIDKIVDFDSPPVDPLVEDFANGDKVKLADGVREVTFFIVTAEAAKLAAKINASQCRSLSVMYGDDLENLVGDLQGTNFTGRKIQQGSLDVQVIDKTHTTAAKVQVKYNYDRSAKETSVDYIKDSSISGFTISSDAVALSDVRITEVTAIVASISFNLGIDFGGVKSRIPAGGLSALLEIFNVTDDALETTSSFTEPSVGSYVAVYTAPVDVNDVMRVQGLADASIQLTYDLKDVRKQTHITV